MAILSAERRNEKLKGKQLRKQGYVPGVLYGKDLEDSLILQFPQKDIKKFLKTNTTGSRVDLEVGNKKYNSLLKEITFTPVANEPEHLSFQTLISGEKVTSTAQIILINKEKASDTILQSLYEINYRAYPSDLFESIEVDMEGKKEGDILRLSDLEIADNEAIEIKTSLDSLVCSVVSHSKATDDISDASDVEESDQPAETV